MFSAPCKTVEIARCDEAPRDVLPRRAWVKLALCCIPEQVEQLVWDPFGQLACRDWEGNIAHQSRDLWPSCALTRGVPHSNVAGSTERHALDPLFDQVHLLQSPELFGSGGGGHPCAPSNCPS